MEEIKTDKIFLDTSIFIQENFFSGRKLKAFLKHAACSDIKLIITPITIKEILSNIEVFSNQANSTLKKGLKEFDNKSKIFKNIPFFNNLFSIQENFEFDKEVEKLKDQFNHQLFNIFLRAFRSKDKCDCDYFVSYHSWYI